jgi:hypothetical protein
MFNPIKRVWLKIRYWRASWVWEHTKRRMQKEGTYPSEVELQAWRKEQKAKWRAQDESILAGLPAAKRIAALKLLGHDNPE